MSNDTVQLVREVSASVQQIQENQSTIDKLVKDFQAAAKADSESAQKVSKEALEFANKLAGDVAKMSSRIVEAEQKLADNVHAGKTSPKTLGQLVIETDAFKAFASGMTDRARIDLPQANTITGQTDSPPVNSDVIVAPQRLPGIVGGAFRALKVRDVLPSGNTTSNLVEYTRELLFTNGAAETAEGVTKPQATLTFELANAPVRTIAHWIKLSKQVREDAPALASYVDTRLRYGTDLKIDSQLLNGDGTGQQISGLLDTGNFTAFTKTSGENPIDSINRMIRLVDAADYSATAIMLHPLTWGGIERTREGSNSGTYLFGNPSSITGPTLWGLPVVLSNAMPETYAWVGAVDMVAQVWNRSGTVVEVFEQDDTNVQKNLLTVRSEARLALAIYRPASAYYGVI